jgi:hypothetical protein
MSFTAKGLLTYFLSLPENWVLYKSIITKTFPDTEGSIDRAFKELQNLGYIKSERVREEGTNLFSGWSHIVYDTPQTIDCKEG